jgi:hypothetical protein
MRGSRWVFWVTTSATLAITATVTAATGNKAHDILVAMPADQQAKALGQVVGEGCAGKSAFFMGMQPENKASWSVLCTNGKSYNISISPDAGGSTKILECSVLKAVAHVDCFKKFSAQ